MSTPLGSIAVIASESAEQAEGANREQLNLLLAQVATCRDTLGRLRMMASGEQPVPLKPVNALLEELGARLALYRPRSRLQLTCEGRGAVPEIRAEPTLQQALLNLLDNAAAVSEQPVECRVNWNADELSIDILDHGPGFQRAAENAGKEDGMGMGLLLANATIEHFGGHVSLLQRTGGGAHVAVRLPLHALQETP
jgi:two-component system, sensor histidine kinase RegB